MHTPIFPQTLWRALTLLLVLAGLRYTPFEQLSTLTLIFIAGVMAIPIAAYRLEYRLFARRAVLSQGCQEGSLARRWLWQGSLAKLASYLAALLIAGLILLTVSLLNHREWLIILTATVALIFLEVSTLAFARRQATEDFLPIFQRGLIKWPTIGLVTGAATVVAFYTDYPLYPEQNVAQLAEQAFAAQLGRFASPLLDYSHALLAAADAVAMYFAQQHVPRVEDNVSKWAFWLYFSFKSAVAAGLVVYLLLGLLTLMSIKERRGWRLLGRTVFEKYFTVTLVLLISLYLYAANITIAPREPEHQQASSDCDQALAALQTFSEERRRVLSKQEQTLQQSLHSDIDTGLQAIFAGAQGGVDSYLDWYFSVLGEYQRLGAALLGDMGSYSPDKLDTLVLDGINSGLRTLNLELDERLVSTLNEAALQAGQMLPPDLDANGCQPAFSFKPPEFEHNSVFVGQPQTVVTGGAIIALTTKKVMAKAGAKGVGKAAGKYGASFVTGLTAATFCGPLAAVCGVGAAGLMWVAVDAGIVTADEALNREEMRAEILANLALQEQLLREKMINMYDAATAARYDLIKNSFKIPEDGF